MKVQESITQARDPIVSFSNGDYEGMFPHEDDSMIISIVVAEYKIERVPVGQGSFANWMEGSEPSRWTSRLLDGAMRKV
ncbi:hypothetical protein CR513_28927, partial [Mucuna pruriens]